MTATSKPLVKFEVGKHEIRVTNDRVSIYDNVGTEWIEMTVPEFTALMLTFAALAELREEIGADADMAGASLALLQSIEKQVPDDVAEALRTTRASLA